MELISVVWDSRLPDDLPVTDAERALLDARLADMEGHPDDQSPWPEVKDRLERLTPLSYEIQVRRAALEEALEDIALARAIEEGDQSELVTRDEVFGALEPSN